jgi:hypothetical protein
LLAQLNRFKADVVSYRKENLSLRQRLKAEASESTGE